MDLLEIDEAQANAILEMQLRRLAALELQKSWTNSPRSRTTSRISRRCWRSPNVSVP